MARDAQWLRPGVPPEGEDDWEKEDDGWEEEEAPDAGPAEEPDGVRAIYASAMTPAAPSTVDEGDEDEGESDADWLLERLVREANRFDLQVGITLTVAGSVITGTLVGVRRYLDAYAEVAQRVYRDGGARARAKAYYAELGATLERQTNEDALWEEQGKGAAPPARYVHLVNARYLPATRGLPADAGFLWRGRLSRVDGYSLGTVE